MGDHAGKHAFFRGARGPDPFDTAAPDRHLGAVSTESWIVYVLVSGDGRRTYVGITRDLDQRLAQHNGELPGGAKSTRAGRPWRLGTVHGTFGSRAEAQRVEWALKRLPGRARLSESLS